MPLGAVTLAHDAAGRVTSVLDGRGTTTFTCYDADDRIVQVSTTSSNCAAASGVTYTYDADGNLTQRQTAATNMTTASATTNRTRPVSRTDTISGTTTSTCSMTYDGASNVLTMTDAGTTTYAYDPANRLGTLAEPDGVLSSRTCAAGVPELDRMHPVHLQQQQPAH